MAMHTMWFETHNRNERPATPAALGMSLLGLAGAVSALMAALMIWMLLTAPADIVVAVAAGPSELAGAMFRVVIDAVSGLLAWL